MLLRAHVPAETLSLPPRPSPLAAPSAGLTAVVHARLFMGPTERCSSTSLDWVLHGLFLLSIFSPSHPKIGGCGAGGEVSCPPGGKQSGGPVREHRLDRQGIKILVITGT